MVPLTKAGAIALSFAYFCLNARRKRPYASLLTHRTTFSSTLTIEVIDAVRQVVLDDLCSAHDVLDRCDVADVQTIVRPGLIEHA